jgi:hypothetical protein
MEYQCKCEKCHGTNRYLIEITPLPESIEELLLRCRTCGRGFTVSISKDDLEQDKKCSEVC